MMGRFGKCPLPGPQLVFGKWFEPVDILQPVTQMRECPRHAPLLRRGIDWHQLHRRLVAAGDDNLLAGFRAGGKLGGLVRADRAEAETVAGAEQERLGARGIEVDHGDARAGARGISLVGAGDTSATHVMKGYFSAISEGGRTTVIYVWDVTDAAGTRVHRIQGQERAASGGGEGWDGVQPATMEAIADETVERLAAWLTARQG